MTPFRLAWAFLTRLPGGRHPVDDAALGRAVPWFPVVGAVLGAIVGAVYFIAVQWLDPTVAAFVAIGFGALITGGFHQDGLADFADSFGGYTQERRIEIMRDSRVGTFGVLALIVGIGIQVAALGELTAWDGFFALIAAHVLARCGAVAVMGFLARSKRSGQSSSVGLGADYLDGMPTFTLGVVAVLVVGAMILGRPTGTAVVAVAVLAALVAAISLRHLGAVTGDVLGAIEQCGEAATLVAVATVVAETGWLW